jgi:hypothetical protein
MLLRSRAILNVARRGVMVQKRCLGTGEVTRGGYTVCYGNPTLGWALTFDRSWQYRMFTMFLIGLLGNSLELMYETHPPPGYSKLPYMKVRRREFWWGTCDAFDVYCQCGYDYEELTVHH